MMFWSTIDFLEYQSTKMLEISLLWPTRFVKQPPNLKLSTRSLGPGPEHYQFRGFKKWCFDQNRFAGRPKYKQTIGFLEILPNKVFDFSIWTLEPKVTNSRFQKKYMFFDETWFSEMTKYKTCHRATRIWSSRKDRFLEISPNKVFDCSIWTF